MIVAATGHRPDKLGGYDPASRLALVGFARFGLGAIAPTKVISGVALGWDQAVAQAAIDLGIPFVAAVPHATQHWRWPGESKRRYLDLLNKAAEVVNVWELPGYQTEEIEDSYRARNRWMVDNAELILACWDGSPGGTAHCIRYASMKNVPFVNGYAGWAHYRESNEWLI